MILPPEMLIHIVSFFKEGITPPLNIDKLFLNIILESKCKLTTKQLLTTSRIVKFETSLFSRRIPNSFIAKYPILFDEILNLFYEGKISVDEMKEIIDGSFNYDSWNSAKKELKKLLQDEIRDIPRYFFDDIERAFNQNYFLKILGKLKSLEALERENLKERRDLGKRDIELILVALLSNDQFEIAKSFISKIDKQEESICLFILTAVYFKNQIAVDFFIKSFYEIYSQYPILIYLFSSFCGNFHQLQSFFENSNELRLFANADTLNSGALCLAAEKGHLQIVKYLMESKYAVPRCQANADNSCGLRLAAYNGHLDVIRYLMESEYAVPRCQANARDSGALREAAWNGHLKVVQYLMENEYAIPRCEANVYNSHALKYAAQNGHLKVVQYLMESEYALPRCQANGGDSCTLRLAASNGHLEVVQYLMESEYAIPRCEANVYNSHALKYAAQNGHLKVVRYLMESKFAVPRCQANAGYSYALKKAAENGHLNVIRYLMESEYAVPRCQANADDSYALGMAAQNGHLNVVRYLMESEYAVPRCKANAGDSYALRWAAKNGHLEVVRYFKEAKERIIAIKAEIEAAKAVIEAAKAKIEAKMENKNESA